MPTQMPTQMPIRTLSQTLGRDLAHRPPTIVLPTPASRIMLWSIAGFTALMIAWASVAEINETATAPGRVVATRPLQMVGNLEGGIVSAILVKPGQVVAAGTPLLTTRGWSSEPGPPSRAWRSTRT